MGGGIGLSEWDIRTDDVEEQPTISSEASKGADGVADEITVQV